CSATIPAALSTRRWRETAGLLIGSAAAISTTGLSPAASSFRISRRFGSPSASNGSPIALAGSPGTLDGSPDERGRVKAEYPFAEYPLGWLRYPPGYRNT